MQLHQLLLNRSRTWILIIAPIISLALLWTWLRRPDALLLKQFLFSDSKNAPLAASDEQSLSSKNGSSSTSTTSHSNATYAPGSMNNKNPNLPAMDDILVILKTGVTEPLEKVTVHLETTFSHVPNFAIFSDYEEAIAGIKTHDVLDRLSPEVKSNTPEFELYNRIREQGRDALTKEDYGDNTNGPFGRMNNPGWKLDKWKFIPMITTALELKPDAKWFVFMEADSYILWPNLVAWLSQLDHRKDWYLGFPMAIGDVIFAYGGSGFVISNPVMRKAAQYIAVNAGELETLVAEQWAGDCALGKVLFDIGVELHWAWPTLQGDKPWELDYFASTDDNNRAWCYPLVSYHHMQPDDIRDVWEIDRDWFKLADPTTKLLLYSDAFRRMILPDILSLRMGWDNDAKDQVITNEGHSRELSLEDCGKICEEDASCLQYRYHSEDRTCFTSSVAKRGSSAAKGVTSDWMIDRIFDKMKQYGATCPKAEFVS